MERRDTEPGFFLVGTGRCGSTLLRKLLRFHPDLYLPKETHWIPILHDLYGGGEIEAEEFLGSLRSVYMAKGKTAYQRILNEEEWKADDFEAALREGQRELPRRDLASTMDLFYRLLAAKHGATRWGDKTPDYGMCMGTLQRLWPTARFVHIVRDGRDVALSMSKVLSFRLLVAWGGHYWPQLAWERSYEGRLEAAGAEIPTEAFYQLWRRRLLRIRDEESRITAGTYLEIDYAELLANPRETLEHLASFLALPDRGEWIERATEIIRPANLARNDEDPEYQALGRNHGPELRALGFGSDA